GERFVEFTAREILPEAERNAWANAIAFIRSFDPADMAVYYYSSYEKSSYRRLRRKFPDVITEEELEAMFDHPNTIDLYSVVTKMTDWPLGSYGIKAIAQNLGFKWRDETPSGALSIQWFNEYLTNENEALLNRVLEYNEDDCKATMVVKDYLKTRMDAT
ncbi:MAG: TM0106 family RecB-like putative nuclease, partial [Blastocatellia bacterium]